MKKDTQNTKQELKKKINGQNLKKSYVIIYLVVLIIIVIGEVVLHFTQNTSWLDLLKDTVGNLMGVLAAFIIFDIFHEKMTKDSYALEMSQQILDTLMSNPDALELFTEEQRKTFIKSTIASIVDDEDANDMINNYLSIYLKKSNDCRIRTAFSYRFNLEDDQKKAFDELIHKKEYYYVQEELTYKIKYLSKKSNNASNNKVCLGFAYDVENLEKFFCDNIDTKEEINNQFSKCIFRETLDIDYEDVELFKTYEKNGTLFEKFDSMFRASLKVDKNIGKLCSVRLIKYGIIAEFEVNHDVNRMNHEVDIVFHMPKKWNSVIEVALVDPTKEPKISLSYNEDTMKVEMYSFLNRGDNTSYENALEYKNGIYRISVNDEWVFPVSGVAFYVSKNS